MEKFWQSKLGKALWNIWRMFFNDDTGISMRKTTAFMLSLVLCFEILQNTTPENLSSVIWGTASVIAGLLGIVTWQNLRQNENTNLGNASGGDTK